MEIVVERVSGLDVHKASVTACVRVPADAGERAEEVETFRMTVASLLALADWLEAHGVTQVAMEATGVDWKPVWRSWRIGSLASWSTPGTSSRFPGARPT